MDPWGLDLLAGTELPTHVGVDVAVEGPGRLRADVGLGVMPGPYVDLTNSAIVALGGYDAATADLVGDVLASTLLVDLRLGWRPFPHEGFHFGVTGSVDLLGGAATATQVLQLVTGSTTEVRNDPVFTAHSTLWMLGPVTGWDLVWKRLVVRPELGMRFTVAANTDIVPPPEVRFDRAAEALSQTGEVYLDETYTDWAHVPFVGLLVGFRAF